MTRQTPIDPIEAILKPPHIDDGGFTNRTLNALSSTRRRHLGHVLNLFCVCVGLFLGLVVFPGAQLITTILDTLTTLNLSTPERTIFSLIALAAVSWFAACKGREYFSI